MTAVTASRCPRCRNPNPNPTLTLTLTLTLTFKVLSLPLDHGQAVQLREGLLAHASVKKVLCSFESPSPSSCSPIPEEHAAHARWVASRPGSRDNVLEPSPPSLSHLFRREDSNCSCIEEQNAREDEGGLAAPVAVRAIENGGGGGFVLTLGERGLGLRQRQGWIVDPSYG